VRPVVFDCDGVLVDTEDIWSSSLHVVLTRMGGADLGSRSLAMRGGSVPEAASLLERESGVTVDVDAFGAEVYRLVLAGIAQGVRAMPGAIELIESLGRSRTLAVASNGSHETVFASLASAGIPDVFDAIVALDGVLRPKPAPDLYLRACVLLGVETKSTVAIEDSWRGATAAKAAGMFVVGVGNVDVFDAVADLVVANLFDPELAALLDL